MHSTGKELKNRAETKTLVRQTLVTRERRRDEWVICGSFLRVSGWLWLAFGGYLVSFLGRYKRCLVVLARYYGSFWRS